MKLCNSKGIIGNHWITSKWTYSNYLACNKHVEYYKSASVLSLGNAEREVRMYYMYMERRLICVCMPREEIIIRYMY